jgi:hypothetical protein
MDAGMVIRIERNVDRAASAALAIASAFAGYALLMRLSTPTVGWAETGAVAAVAYLLSRRILNAIGPRAAKLPVPVFDVREIDVSALEQPTELLLTDVCEPAPSPAEDALFLDDILAELGPDSRVVRLFDPSAMPTAGQLKARIDRHLECDSAAVSAPDASAALHEALAELRRSLG